MAMGLIDAEANSAFDLFNGPVMRVLVVRVAEDEHVMIVNTHHQHAHHRTVEKVERTVRLRIDQPHGHATPLLQAPSP